MALAVAVSIGRVCWIVDDLITVIVLEVDGVTYGVNAWRSNAPARQIFKEGELR